MQVSQPGKRPFPGSAEGEPALWPSGEDGAVKKTRDLSSCPSLDPAPSRKAPPEDIQVWIAQPVSEAPTPLLTRERLRAEAELRLALAGLTPKTPAEDEWQGGPCLGVIVNLNPPHGNGRCAFSLEVFYVEGEPTALGPFGPSLHLKWCRERCGELPGTQREGDLQPLYEALGHLVQEFLEEYLAGLPQPGVPRRLLN